MPVIVNSREIHPFLSSLGGLSAIDAGRAAHQDIRPLEIAVLNLMADKIATEEQLARWIGRTPLQINLTFVATDRYVQGIEAGRIPKNAPVDHIRKFYRAWSSIKDQKFDGLIVTGVNALQPRVTDETFWDEVSAILEWSETNVLSSLFLCWGAKAALKHFHNIDSVKGEKKTFGLFEHRIVSDKTELLFGLPDRFSAPVSRWKNPDPAAIAACPALEVVATSDEAGPNILVESESYGRGRLFQRRVYVLNHPEYDTETLGKEYVRDSAKDPQTPLPKHYFPGDDPTQPAPNSWRHTAFLYTNWISSLYPATPYDRQHIPRTMSSKD